MRRLFLTLLLCLLGASEATPQAPPGATGMHPWRPWSCCPSVGCCPDDYCKKPCVIHPGPYCGGCDDYCRKTFPSIRDIPRCGGCDDYCRKPLPSLLCPPWSPFLRCAPPEACCPPWKRH